MRQIISLLPCGSRATAKLTLDAPQGQYELEESVGIKSPSTVCFAVPVDTDPERSLCTEHGWVPFVGEKDDLHTHHVRIER